MSEESLNTLSDIERTSLISQSQIESLSDSAWKETEGDVSNVRERKLTTKGRAYQIETLHKKKNNSVHGPF